jgi:enterochelin esterase-like enzyme
MEVSDELTVRGLPPRRVTVWLPPDYGALRAGTYPLLVALDGQTMPQWRLGETIAALSAAGEIEPPVTVAVPASAERIDEHGTAGELDFARRGRLARAFQELLAGEVLPWVRERYHVAVEPARTGIFGASMGGLCAFDTAWRRPQVFGRAAGQPHRAPAGARDGGEAGVAVVVSGRHARRDRRSRRQWRD